MTCRDEILVAARALAGRAADSTFTIEDVISELRGRGSRYPDSTLRTHVASRMCTNGARTPRDRIRRP